MHILLNNVSVKLGVASAVQDASAHGVTVSTARPGKDLADDCTDLAARAGSTALVVTRVPLPDSVSRHRPELTVLFPGAGADPWRTNPATKAAWLLPRVVAGPLTGRPGVVHRRLSRSIRGLGVPVRCRRDMHYWLRVTSAWLAPLCGAVLAARERGLSLASAADLITITTRAARERLRVMHVGGLPVDIRYLLLLAMPEAAAVAAVRSVARAVPPEGRSTWLPSPAEAVEVSQKVARIAGCLRLRTPAADFLDQFSVEEAVREAAASTESGSGVSAVVAAHFQEAQHASVSNG